jgi:hypothetical protein
MSIPTNDDIYALLDRLEGEIADDLESAFLDFKPWRDPKKDMAVAIEYAVCFTNAKGGVVVFGVADKKRGRAAAIHGAGRTGKVLVVRIPQGNQPPYGTAHGLYKVRVGKNCMPLDAQRFALAEAEAGHVDWSGQLARDVSRDDLDPLEIARARNVLRGRDTNSDLLAFDDTAFLTALGAMREGKVTHAGLLLFGRDDVLRARCPQHVIHYAHLTSETEVARNDLLQCGLLQALERITAFFQGPANPEQEVRTGFFKMRIPAYPVTVVQEALLNAMTHRNYAESVTKGQEAESRLLIGWARFVEASIHAATDDHEVADDSFRKAADAFVLAGSTKGLIRTCSGFGASLAEQGKLEEDSRRGMRRLHRTAVVRRRRVVARLCKGLLRRPRERRYDREGRAHGTQECARGVSRTSDVVGLLPLRAS